MINNQKKNYTGKDVARWIIFFLLVMSVSNSILTALLVPKPSYRVDTSADQEYATIIWGITVLICIILLIVFRNNILKIGSWNYLKPLSNKERPLKRMSAFIVFIVSTIIWAKLLGWAAVSNADWSTEFMAEPAAWLMSPLYGWMTANIVSWFIVRSKRLSALSK